MMKVFLVVGIIFQQPVDQIKIQLWPYECSPWLHNHVCSPPGEAWQYGTVFSELTTTKVGEYSKVSFLVGAPHYCLPFQEESTAREARHQEMYLEMYNKGKDSAKFERLDEVSMKL